MCSYFTNGSNWLQLRPPWIVYRISYFVYRDKRNKEKRTWDSKPSRTHPGDEKWTQWTTGRPAGFGGRVKRWRRRSPSPSASCRNALLTWRQQSIGYGDCSLVTKLWPKTIFTFLLGQKGRREMASIYKRGNVWYLSYRAGGDIMGSTRWLWSFDIKLTKGEDLWGAEGSLDVLECW